MLDSIIGSVFFEFIGAFSKWLFYAVIYSLKGEKTKSFKDIWNGRKDSKKSNLLMYGISNIVLGIIVISFLIFFILWLGI